MEDGLKLDGGGEESGCFNAHANSPGENTGSDAALVLDECAMGAIDDRDSPGGWVACDDRGLVAIGEESGGFHGHHEGQ